MQFFFFVSQTDFIDFTLNRLGFSLVCIILVVVSQSLDIFYLLDIVAMFSTNLSSMELNNFPYLLGNNSL